MSTAADQNIGVDEETAALSRGRGLGDVLLVGAGASTQAVAQWLVSAASPGYETITLYTGNATGDALENARALAASGMRVVEGTQRVEGNFDLGVVSPGIPQIGEFYASAQASCQELVSEPELAWRESPRDWVGITGTNGKTTTTMLTAHLLSSAGIGARAVGNVGLPPISVVSQRQKGEVMVAELSSFQLASTRFLAPRVGVLLNVTPDHVEWHGSLEAYKRAKFKMFDHMTPSDLCILGSDRASAELAAELRPRGLRVCTVARGPVSMCGCLLDAAWIDEQDRLRVRLRGTDHVLCRYSDMRLSGPHNAQDALSAAAAAIEMGASDEAVIEGLLSFSPLAHRMEPCGTTSSGVHLVDDSKGTNVDAALKALGSFEQGTIEILLGGHDKGTDLTELSQECARVCRAVIAYGEAGPRFARAVRAAVQASDSSCQVEEAPHMLPAARRALELAVAGDTVLLSPACSSFDEFTGYEQRGDVFKAWAAEVSGTAPVPASAPGDPAPSSDLATASNPAPAGSGSAPNPAPADGDDGR